MQGCLLYGCDVSRGLVMRADSGLERQSILPFQCISEMLPGVLPETPAGDANSIAMRDLGNYSPFPNEVLACLMRGRFSQLETQFLLFVVRESLGYSAGSSRRRIWTRRLTQTELAKLLRVPRSSLSTAVTGLRDNKVILVEAEAHTYRRRYQLNLCWEGWQECLE